MPATLSATILVSKLIIEPPSGTPVAAMTRLLGTMCVPVTSTCLTTSNLDPNSTHADVPSTPSTSAATKTAFHRPARPRAASASAPSRSAAVVFAASITSPPHIRPPPSDDDPCPWPSAVPHAVRGLFGVAGGELVEDERAQPGHVAGAEGEDDISRPGELGHRAGHRVPDGLIGHL